jgi:hypothetical protein
MDNMFYTLLEIYPWNCPLWGELEKPRRVPAGIGGSEKPTKAPYWKISPGDCPLLEVLPRKLTPFGKFDNFF